MFDVFSIYLQGRNVVKERICIICVQTFEQYCVFAHLTFFQQQLLMQSSCMMVRFPLVLFFIL